MSDSYNLQQSFDTRHDKNFCKNTEQHRRLGVLNAPVPGHCLVFTFVVRCLYKVLVIKVAISSIYVYLSITSVAAR